MSSTVSKKRQPPRPKPQPKPNPRLEPAPTPAWVPPLPLLGDPPPLLVPDVERQLETGQAKAEQPRGLICHTCRGTMFDVVRTEKKPGGKIARTRVCVHCGTLKRTTEVDSLSLLLPVANSRHWQRISH
jgi:hypothetical protein